MHENRGRKGVEDWNTNRWKESSLMSWERSDGGIGSSRNFKTYAVYSKVVQCCKTGCLYYYF
eukprot:scaffold3357_cov268-Chaetoceros_neogracile.AAC.41